MPWILSAGSPWRDLPDRYGPWQTADNRFNRWRKDGTFDAVLERLQMRLDEEGRIDWDVWMFQAQSTLDRCHSESNLILTMWPVGLLASVERLCKDACERKNGRTLTESS